MSAEASPRRLDQRGLDAPVEGTLAAVDALLDATLADLRAALAEAGTSRDADPGPLEESFLIGAPVDQGSGHATEQVRVDGSTGTVFEYAADPTHPLKGLPSGP